MFQGLLRRIVFTTCRCLVGEPTVEVLRYSFVVCSVSVVSVSSMSAHHCFGLVRAFGETCVPDHF